MTLEQLPLTEKGGKSSSNGSWCREGRGKEVRKGLLLLGSCKDGLRSSAGGGGLSMAETTGSLTGASRPKGPENAGPSTLD